MSAENISCDPILVGRLFDGEVDEAERVRVEAHLAACPSCRRLLEDHQAIGDLFQSSLDQSLTDSEKNTIEERVLAQVRKKGRQPGAGLKKLLAPKRLIPLAAVSALLLFFLTSFFGAQTPLGPSAIVKSFQGDYTSVMVMETPETRNTIIWFDETT